MIHNSNDNMVKKEERNIGIDSLRIVAMVFIVILHVLGHGGILDACKDHRGGYYLVSLLNILAYSGVNIFAIITGYVSYSETGLEHKWASFVNLWIEVCFYSLLIIFISHFVFGTGLSLKSFISGFMPIANNTYWYFTSYFIVFLFGPLIIGFINSVTGVTLKTALVLGLLILYLSHFIDGLLPHALLLYLFLVGAIIKKFSLLHVTKKKCIATIIICLITTWALQIAFEYIGKRSIIKILLSYDSPLIILMACSFCVLFSQIRIRNSIKKGIIYLTPSVFSVYLLNDHPLIRDNFISKIFNDSFSSNVMLTICWVIVFSLLFFIVSVMIDVLRRNLFHLLKISSFSKVLVSWFSTIANKCCDFVYKHI